MPCGDPSRGSISFFRPTWKPVTPLGSARPGGFGSSAFLEPPSFLKPPSNVCNVPLCRPSLSENAAVCMNGRFGEAAMRRPTSRQRSAPGRLLQSTGKGPSTWTAAPPQVRFEPNADVLGLPKSQFPTELSKAVRLHRQLVGRPEGHCSIQFCNVSSFGKQCALVVRPFGKHCQIQVER